jgi:predicted Kef-type K+ transport protein
MSVIDKISKEKLIGYFAVLWGVSFLLNGVSGLVFNIRDMVNSEVFQLSALVSTINISIVIGSFLDMLMGIVLVVLGFKILKAKGSS